MQVSYFKNAKSSYPCGTLELIDALKMVKQGMFKPQILKYRETNDSELKKNIPAYTASGTFAVRRVADIVEYNGILVIDIDYKDNTTVDFTVLKSRLKTAKTVLAFHDSVGGKGIAVYIKTNNQQINNHSIYYNAICDLFESHLGVKCDRACSDISRLRFFSYDENIYFNPKAEEFKYEIKRPELPTYDIEKSKKYLLAYIDKVIASGVDITADYHDWVSIAMAFSDCFGESGRSLFHGISMAHPRYKYTQTDKQYDVCLRRIKPVNKLTINTFYYICNKYGIKDVE
jgi:hypothetical protein